MTARVLRVAHRAANDLALLRAALDAGADLVEGDVHLYRGRLEVRHEKTLGPLPWLWDRWYLVPASGPRLSLTELAAALPRERRVMLDLKGWHPWLGRRVRAAMATAAPGVPYVVCSRHWRMLRAFRDVPDVDVVHSVRSRAELGRLARQLGRHPSWGIALHRDLLSRIDVRSLPGVEVVLTWPVNDVAAFDAVVALGATGVISDELSAVSLP